MCLLFVVPLYDMISERGGTRGGGGGPGGGLSVGAGGSFTVFGVRGS